MPTPPPGAAAARVSYAIDVQLLPRELNLFLVGFLFSESYLVGSLGLVSARAKPRTGTGRATWYSTVVWWQGSSATEYVLGQPNSTHTHIYMLSLMRRSHFSVSLMHSSIQQIRSRPAGQGNRCGRPRPNRRPLQEGDHLLPRPLFQRRSHSPIGPRADQGPASRHGPRRGAGRGRCVGCRIAHR